jgi:flagellar basal body-associated protein FliL
MTQSCSNCGSPLTAGAAFCRSCGTKVEQPNACRSCGTANAAGATFCANCGNALQAQVAQRTYAPGQAHFGTASRNKWVLPGVGGVIAAVVIVGVVLMMGGSDSAKKKDEPAKGQAQAKTVLPPDKVASSSEDLAATIANLNKSQLNVVAMTAGSKPVDSKELDRGLAEVAANAMKVAELSNILAKTNSIQGSDQQTIQGASQIAQQYEAVAQSSYAQVIDAQNLRQQIAQGTATLPAVTQTISNYGAQMWNTSVVIQGVTGNPFVPFITGTPAVEISVTLAPAAVQRVTVQFGPSLTGWVATNAVLVNWPVYVNLVPVPVFDPFDDALLRRMLTLEGQLDPFLSQRLALARLEQFRRLAELDRLGMFSLGGWTDIVNTRGAGGTYFSMANLPPEGMLGLNMRLPAGIAVADASQVKSGFIPSYKNGFGMTYAFDIGSAPGSGGAPASKSATTVYYATSSPDSVEMLAKVPVVQSAPVGSGTVTISNVSAGAFSSSQDKDNPSYGAVPVTYTVNWNGQAPGAQEMFVRCSDGSIFMGASGTQAVTTQFSVYRGSSMWLVCTLNALMPGPLNQKTSTTISSDSRNVQPSPEDQKYRADETKKSEDDYARKLEALKNRLEGTINNPADLLPNPQGGAGNISNIANQPPVMGLQDDNKPNETKPAETKPADPPKPAVTQPNVVPPPAQPQQPAPESNRADCLQINRGPLNNTETAWFAANCGTAGKLLTANDCNFYRNSSRPGWINAWFVQTCPIQVDPTPTPAVCGSQVVDTGLVPGGVGHTNFNMDPRCAYRVCLTGTITGTKGGQSTSYNPAAAFMVASPGGSLAGGCVVLQKVSGTVSFSCDGSKFVGYTFSNAFAYTVTRLGNAQ